MYARELDGRVLTFFVSGKLWKRSLIMRDSETGTEWSHLLGTGQAGPLTGARLTVLPSIMSNWGLWLAKYPNTTVSYLNRTAREFDTNLLWATQRFGIGLAEEGVARFWSFEDLQATPIVNDAFRGEPVVVFFDDVHKTSAIWERTIAGETLSFEFQSQASAAETPADTRVVDVSTGSHWDLVKGTAISGKFAGTQLQASPGIVSFRDAWQRFYAETTIWQPANPTD